MRKRWLAVAVFSGLGAFAVSAAAEDEFDVKVSGRQVTVTAKGDWHINPDYPWKCIQTREQNGCRQFSKSVQLK